MPTPTAGTRLFTTDQDFRILTWSDCDVAIVSGKKGETGRPEDMRLPSEEAVALFLEQWIAATLREPMRSSQITAINARAIRIGSNQERSPLKA